MSFLSDELVIGRHLGNAVARAVRDETDDTMRYMLLDFHNSLFQSRLIDTDLLGAYGIPDHPLGQVWYGWEALSRDFDRDLLRWGASLFLREPTIYLIAEFQGLLRRLPNYQTTQHCEGLDLMVPRLLAGMDHRRAAFLYPYEEGFNLYETPLTNYPFVEKLPSLRSYRQRCYAAMIELCDIDIDPIVTWNRLCTMGRILYYQLICHRLSPACPRTLQAIGRIKDYHTYLRSEIPK